MIAFFDSLVQRELEGWSSDSSGEDMVGPMMAEYDPADRESRPTMEEEVRAESLSRVVVSTPEQSGDEDDSNAPISPLNDEASDAIAQPTLRSSGNTQSDKKTISELIASRRGDYLKFTNKVAEKEKLARQRGKRVRERRVNKSRGIDDVDETNSDKKKSMMKTPRKRKKSISSATRIYDDDTNSSSSSSSSSSSPTTSSSSSSSSSSSNSSSSSPQRSKPSSSSPEKQLEQEKTKSKRFAEILESMPTESSKYDAEDGDCSFRSKTVNRTKRNYRRKEESDEESS